MTVVSLHYCLDMMQALYFAPLMEGRDGSRAGACFVNWANGQNHNLPDLPANDLSHILYRLSTTVLVELLSYLSLFEGLPGSLIE